MAYSLASVVCLCCTLLISSTTVSIVAQTVTVSVHPEKTSAPRKGDTVTLRCEALDFIPESQFLSWSAMTVSGTRHIITWENELYKTADPDVYSVFENATTDPSTVPEIQELVIRPASQDLSGTYKCRVVQRQLWNTKLVVDALLPLTVYPRDIFPTCHPNGAGSLLEGNALSCYAEANVVTLSITKTGSSSPEAWTPVDDMLVTSVIPSDDGVTYNCSSVAREFSNISLSCLIGPLSVTPLSTPPPPTTSRPPTSQQSRPSPPVTEARGNTPPSSDRSKRIDYRALKVLLVTLPVALTIIMVATVVCAICERRRKKHRPNTVDYRVVRN